MSLPLQPRKNWGSAGIQLTPEWLAAHKQAFYRKRIFYIVSSEADSKGVYKFGQAHPTVRNAYQSMGRLKQYAITYGRVDADNRCTGVHLHYLLLTHYVPNTVHRNRTRVHKIEKAMKAQLADHLDRTRGKERTKAGTRYTLLKSVLDRCGLFNDTRARVRRQPARQAKTRARANARRRRR